ncbi:SIS domain-containing protein [Rhizobium ruizarguesonis]|uniref:KpsF/GutQ family sugar-phosphate isomerase n=1 Tax=Rhizobium TaxID=379 RepID=UPI000BEA43C3|nr:MULTISPECIES: SIS domain-containing protein [unclassified Rhizobium]MDF0661577.1 SIS domain-containing protein [Rhizobium sp. BC49]PDS87610.1 capsule biosynthesis protein [Rhizobium sp. L18]
MSDIREYARQIIEAEATAIRAIQLGSTFDQAVEIIEACKGKVIVTGMGKAGIVGQRFSTVLCSTGTPAVFVHPGEAAHGDLGILGEGDCLFALSTSGKTREVVEIVELSRHLGSHKVVAITSHPESDLRKASDIVIDMGIVTEPCPLGLTPTASIAVMSAITDALTLVVMRRRGFTKRDYGLRHHGGYLGAQARLDNILEESD